MAKPELARGMRDFSPQDIALREYMFNTIAAIYRQYGFMKLETPVIENLSVLTDKYGEEGDKLLFKILNNGEYLGKVSPEDLQAKDHSKITPQIADKGLRYDLTVPLARYVVMNRNDIVFPFKRYQIDKVWRADRPQKGRYREFYQCDGDVIGSYSMLYDAECVLILDAVLRKLHMPPFTIHISNRKVLSGMAEVWGFADKFGAFAIAIDKLDKIGEHGVVAELGNRGFSESQIHSVQRMFRLQGSLEEKLAELDKWFVQSETGRKGVEELRKVMTYLQATSFDLDKLELDLKLARGLDYYTSTIFEVTLNDISMGSIASGGRYDELTAGFGMPDMPGVGISFGAERIFDILKDMDEQPAYNKGSVTVLLANFGGAAEGFAFGRLQALRAEGIAAEMYPGADKMKKQFTYADKKGIPCLLLLGEDEMQNGAYPLKDLASGMQEELGWEALLTKLMLKKK